MPDTTCSAGPRCATWADHRWSAARVVATGRHPMLGAYQRVVERCEHCGREVSETEWLRPQRATKEDQ